MVSFHSNPKEGQCQRVFKLSYNTIVFISQASIKKMDSEKAEEPEIKLPTSIGS